MLSWILLGCHVVVGFAAAIAISLRRKPATAIAWIFTTVFIPVVGAVVFLLIGVGRLPKRRREQQVEVNRLMLARTDVREHSSSQRGGWVESAITLNERLGALPMVKGNRTTLIEGYTDSFDAMIAAIDTPLSSSLLSVTSW